MAMTPTEAAAALSDIETTTRRGMTLRGYRTGGPILMMWSVIWALGYLSMGLLPPQYTGLVWLPLDIIGIVGSILLSRRALPSAMGAQTNKDMTWRMLGGMATVMAFITAVFAVFQPTDPAVFMAFPGLLIGVIYAVIGFWVAPRYILIGAAMFVLTLVGFFAFKPWLATDGNLGSHLTTLEKAGYVTLEKDFVGKRPRTRVALTLEGRRAFRRHVDYLRALVEGVDENEA